MIRSARFPLYLALALYVLFRAWVLATNFDAVAVPVYEVPGMGNHAWVIAEGREGAPWYYYYDNAGAQLLTGYLAAPLYALFGPSYLVLKLVPFVLGVGLLGMVWRFLRRNVGYISAVVGVFSFALAPPTLSKYSLLAKGNHFEGLFFLFVPVVLYFEAQRRRGPYGDTPVRGWLFCAGLTAGLAFCVYFGSMLAMALLGLVGLTFGVRRGLADLRYVLPGLALGLSPFIGLVVGTRWRAFDFAERFSTPDPRKSTGEMWSKAHSLVVDTLPQGACFEPLGTVPAAVGEWLWIGALAVACAAGLSLAFSRRTPRVTRAAALLCCLYLPLVLGVIAVGVLSIRPKSPPVEILGVRYLVSYYFFGLLTIAIAVDLLVRRGGLRRGLGLAMTATVVATWLFVLPMGRADFSHATDGLRYPGYFLRNYGSLFQGRDIAPDKKTREFIIKRDRMTEIIRRFDGAERTDILFSTGNSLASVADVSRGGIDLPWIVGGFPEEFHRDLARGAGGYLRARMPLSGDLDGRIRGQLDEVLAGPYGEAVAEGLGMSLEFPLRRNLPNIRRRSERALTVVPEAWREAVRRGMALADPPPVPE